MKRHAAIVFLVWVLAAPLPPLTGLEHSWNFLKAFPTRQACEAQRHRHKGAQCLEGGRAEQKSVRNGITCVPVAPGDPNVNPPLRDLWQCTTPR